MPTLLFKLTHVPDEEAQDIRNLLSENDIRFYETDAGFWRVGLDAIWVPDETQLCQARELMRAYQIDRTARQKQNYAELVEQGQAPDLWQKFRAQPVRFVGFILAIVFVLTLTLIPFLMLMY